MIDTAQMFQESSLATDETQKIIELLNEVIAIGKKRYEDRRDRGVYDSRNP